jgi:ribonuclease HI
MIEVYTDGACEPRNPGGIPAFGFVVYHEGVLIHEESGAYNEPGTSNIAEYAGIIAALAYLAGAGLTGERVEIKSDSQLVINQLSGYWAVRSNNLKPLYWQVKELERLFLKVSYRWIPRQQNEYADMLSKAVYRN